MKKVPKPLKTIGIILLILLALFLYGRFGWRLHGFRGCEKAMITELCVTPEKVTIKGDYPGSFPTGYIGCHYEEYHGELRIGFKFSSLFGMFDSSSFEEDITINNPVSKIYMKGSEDEELIWEQD